MDCPSTSAYAYEHLHTCIQAHDSGQTPIIIVWEAEKLVSYQTCGKKSPINER